MKKGDNIAIIAPARHTLPEEIVATKQLFEQWGLNVVIPDGLFERRNQFAGDDNHRAAILQKVLDDDSINAILCARGGYGTVRIVDKIDFTHFSHHPKTVIGYSDITVLHSHIHRHCHLPTLHATMPINITQQDLLAPSPAITSLHDILMSTKETTYSIPPYHLNRCGSACGQIVGGNLSILYSLIGSTSDIDTDGKILFIEDLDEYLYHIDRMMINLKRGGKLSKIKGLIVGGMTDMHDNKTPFGKTAQEIIYDAVAEYTYPVIFDAPFGHLGDNNLALPLGAPARLCVESTNVTLSINNPFL